MEGTPLENAARHLTLRGKNLCFLAKIAEATQFDPANEQVSVTEFKRAFTPNAVKAIYEAIPPLWPDIDDFERCIESETKNVAALYTGSYEPQDVIKAVVRLSLYCDKVYLVDPFLRYTSIRDEYNPVVHPEQNRSTAIKFSYLWFSLMPWIHKGIVSFVRSIEDFVPALRTEIYTIQKQRIETNPQLKAVLDEETKRQVKQIGFGDGGMGDIYFLSMPDEILLQQYRDIMQQKPEIVPYSTEQEFLKYIQNKRDNHPYFVQRLPGQHGEIIQHTSGSSYELAKRMCAITNSHIVTDMRSRWKEVEIDRPTSGIDLEAWSPFAKAFTQCELKLLNNVPIALALRLREESRLESLRLFLRKVWKTCRDPDEFSSKNPSYLAAELRDEVAKAKEEWQKIDQEILKWVATTGGVAGTAVSAGWMGFLPAAIGSAVAGVTTLIQSAMKRHSFKERYPAGLFLGVKTE